MISGVGVWAEDDELSGAPGSRRAQRTHVAVLGLVVVAAVVVTAAGVILVAVQ